MRILTKSFIFVLCVLCICALIGFSGAGVSLSYAFGHSGYKGIDLFPDRYASKVDEVYLGGTPVGISLIEKGLVIIGFTDVITDKGAISPTAGTPIRPNDILLSINGLELKGAEDIYKIVGESEGEITLKLLRGKRTYETKLTPVLDSLTKQRKMGIYVKEGIDGVGTLTYARTDNGRYGALGHAIIDSDTKCYAGINSGALYSCVIDGYVKGTEGKAGELKGIFSKGLKRTSVIDNNNSFGIYGEYEKKLIDGRPKIKIGNRQNVRPGKAYICTTIKGTKPTYYEIEIIKSNHQNSPSEKSMVIRITDQRLLRTTGGIVQGMSGSPIIQNDRLVGAVTHVFINDPTKGYGLYIEWMLDN